MKDAFLWILFIDLMLCHKLYFFGLINEYETATHASSYAFDNTVIEFWYRSYLGL